MTDATMPRQDSHRIRQWHFAILRFAITLDQTDRTAALAIAAEMDRCGSVTTGRGFTFFIRTSVKFCDAIAAKDDPEAIATIRAHLRNIEHPPLRRAFEAALELDRNPAEGRGLLNRSRDNLWKGLPAPTIAGDVAALKPASSGSE